MAGTITVKQLGGPKGNLVVGTGVELISRGLDKIDPPIRMSHTVQGAFEILPDRVEIVGENVTGAFTRTDDFVRLEIVAGRLRSTRYTMYEFSGWQGK